MSTPSSAILRWWYRPNLSAGARLLLFPLQIASWIVAAVAWCKRAGYRRSLLRRTRANARVISVGNLVAGGTGKTPIVMLLARELQRRGMRVAVVSRGYGGRAKRYPLVVSRGDGVLAGAAEAGDEPVLVATRCPGVSVVVAPNRADAARLAAEKLGAVVLLLDDGFQHQSLARDLDLVVVDAERVFGNGAVLPLGPLREPKGALAHAHAVWFSRGDAMSERARRLEAIARSRGQLVVKSDYRIADVVEISSKGSMGRDALSGAKVFLLSAIALPESFRTVAQKAGAVIAGERAFPDHHAFRRDEIDEVDRQARAAGAAVVVTTEKDAVKIAGARPSWLAVALEVEITEGGEALWRRILG